jgi:diaminopimelate decarboxylase
VIERQVEALQAVLRRSVEIAYAVKANPSLAVVTHLGGLGLGADVASGGELALAGRAGIRADRIVMTGPGKRDDELRAAVAPPSGPSRWSRSASSPPRGDRRRGRPRQPVMLRAAVPRSPRSSGSAWSATMARQVRDGRADLHAAARRAGSSRTSDCSASTRSARRTCWTPVRSLAHVAATVRVARRVALASGVALELVDVGGGLGIPYEPHEESLDLGASAPD